MVEIEAHTHNNWPLQPGFILYSIFFPLLQACYLRRSPSFDCKGCALFSQIVRLVLVLKISSCKISLYVETWRLRKRVASKAFLPEKIETEKYSCGLNSGM